MKNSETIVIKRSQIHLNPYNIKRHTEEQVKLQKKNFRKVGFLGGVVWNKTTGNLIDGHRRIQAMDLLNKYDGTPETDYDVKVEMVEFDEKTEKQQLAYMALGNSKADYNLVARFIEDIDYADVGLSESDYQQILHLNERTVDIPDVGMSSFDDAFLSPVTELDDTDAVTTEEIVEQHENKPKMTAEEVKREKQHCDDVASNRHSVQDTFVALSFESVDDKCIFCELLGLTPTNSMVIPGTEVMKLIQ